MARHIVGNFLKDPSDLEAVWPGARLLPNGDMQSHAPDGIEDPRAKLALWEAAAKLHQAELQRMPKDPEAAEKIRQILGAAGFELAA